GAVAEPGEAQPIRRGSKPRLAGILNREGAGRAPGDAPTDPLADELLAVSLNARFHPVGVTEGSVTELGRGQNTLLAEACGPAPQDPKVASPVRRHVIHPDGSPLRFARDI